MHLVNSRLAHHLDPVWRSRRRLARVLPRALPLLAGFWALDVEAKVVFSVMLDPILQQNYYFSKPSGSCHVYDASEGSFTVGCTAIFPVGDASSKVQIKQRGTDINFGSILVDDPALGEGFVTLRDNIKHDLARCGGVGGLCDKPAFMDTAPPPPIHFEDVYSVIVVKKVCAYFRDPGCA